MEAEKWPLDGMKWAEREGVFDVDLGHKRRRADIKDQRYGIVKRAVGHSKLIDGYTLVYRTCMIVG